MDVSLYKVDSKGKMRVWSISHTPEHDEICISHGVMGGAISEKWEDIIPKSNRSYEQQCELRVNSLIKKKRDKGYVDTVEGANDGPSNQLGFPIPMKAQPLDKVKDIDWRNVAVQRKYNGHRCVVTRQGHRVMAYSYNGIEITSIVEILDELQHLPEGVFLDGELYHHGTKLQTISSWVKRRQEGTRNLVFVVFDSISGLSFRDRFLDAYHHVASATRTFAATTLWGVDEGDIPELMSVALEEGYEGLIIRQTNWPYETNKRSKSCIKYKKFIDHEYVVIGIEPSKDGWAILSCHLDDHREFQVSAPGTMNEKANVLQNRESYVGRTVNVRFAEYTQEGVPFHPVATGWRHKSGE